jgi:hypothetical protein
MGTEVRKIAGAEASRTALGVNLDVLEIYAERDLERSARIVEELDTGPLPPTLAR